MAEDKPPVYLVDPDSDPVTVKICGRASYQNSAPLQAFFQAMIAQGKSNFRLEFGLCTAMDSTFLGIIAGAAIQAGKQLPPGKLYLSSLEQRNLQLIRNLGLHRLTEIEEIPVIAEKEHKLEALEGEGVVNRGTMLEAHQTLSGIDEANREKFQDVVAFLKKESGD
jgi:anti-sigma B factor antagonist